MPEQYDGTAACRRAKSLLASGQSGNALIRTSGRVEHALPVMTPASSLHSWMVPVTLGDRLAGFFQFLPDLTLVRYSSFQRRAETIEGCPETELWLDETAILRRFQEKALPGERVGEPYLTYDRVPSRLAWAAQFTAADGTSRTLYTAGRAIWEAAGSDGDEATATEGETI